MAFPTISMQVAGEDGACDPLASPPPHFHHHSGDTQCLRSYAESTRDHHVRPMFEDIPLRAAVLRNGQNVMVFSPSEVGRLSTPFTWSLVGKFESLQASLMKIRITMKRVRSFSQEFFVAAIDDHHVIIRFQNRSDFVNAYIKKD